MITPNSNIFQSQYKISIQCRTSFVLRPRKQNKQRKNYGRMAKTFDRSIKNGICFLVKWQLLLWGTFQARKSSIFPPQYLTPESLLFKHLAS